MKKVIVTLAIVMQTVFVFAGSGRQTQVVKAKHDHVKVYLQAGTSTEVIKSLKSTDELSYVRPFNTTWSIVQVDGKVGYVLTSELLAEKAETTSSAFRK
jgi:hypothetical protein